MKLTYIYKSGWVYTAKIRNDHRSSGFGIMTHDYLSPELKIVHIYHNQHLKKFGWGVEKKLFQKVIGLL